MIQNRNLKEEPCIFAHREFGDLFEVTDVVNFQDCLLQIKEEGVYGYFIKFKNKEIRIDKNGNLEEYPNDLFEMYTNILLKML